MLTLIDDATGAFMDHRRGRRLAVNLLARYEATFLLWQRWRYAQMCSTLLHGVEIDHFRAFLAYLQNDHIPHTNNKQRPEVPRRGMAPATVRQARTMLRAFWTFAGDEGWLLDHQIGFFRGDRIPTPQLDDSDRAAWDDALVEQLLAACVRRPAEEIARNRAMVLMIYESGVRIDELCRLTDDIVDLPDKSVRITGKGGKRRWVFWGERTAAALAAYLEIRRGAVGGPLFRSHSPKNNGGPLSADAVRQLFKQLAKNAGITLPAGAPVHAGRHGFAHAMIDGGADISQVAQLMGHSDVKTTMRYLRERKDKLQDIHKRAQARRQI